jgi:two-component system sensor histidine kinase KdpD
MRNGSRDMDDLRPSPEALLREYAQRARLIVYLAAAPGAGKTRRLITDAQHLRAAGVDVVIGRLETKHRGDLEALAAGLPTLPTRALTIGDATFEEFDLDAALRRKPEVIILDELAHTNLAGSRNEKRWQDAQALRDAGIGVIGALNIAHVETVAATAERALGRPVREIVPLSFLQRADEVVALDTSPQILQQRLKSGKIVSEDDAERALAGPFSDMSLYALRELLLRAVDALTVPGAHAEQSSIAVAIALPEIPLEAFLRRTAAVVSALDFSLAIAVANGVDRAALVPLAQDLGAEVLPETIDAKRVDPHALPGALIVIPRGSLARFFARRAIDQNLFIVDASQTYLGGGALGHALVRTAGDRIRRGYGKLTVYLGAAAGSGKTYAMLDRAHQLVADGVDVVAAFVETHKRAETAALLEGLELLPRKLVHTGTITYEELDRDALLPRKPSVALIDELAHTNAPGSTVPKRYEDVLAVLRAGIDVITTLNVQHLEGLNDTVERLTGTVVRETLPDEILALADEVILVDATPETLRSRLRDGKIYPRDRIEPALQNFFRRENLEALRELALREALRVKLRRKATVPFDRLMLGLTGTSGDERMMRRANALAARLQVEFAVVCISSPKRPFDAALLATLRAEAIRSGAAFLEISSSDTAAALLRASRERPETTLAVGQPAKAPRWLELSLARRLLDAGARELIVLAPIAPSEDGRRVRPARD